MKYLFLIFALFPLIILGKNPRCYREITRKFFNRTIVQEAFSLNQVKQGFWVPVSKDLERRSKRIDFIVQQRAKEFKPNPLRRPFNIKFARELLLEVLEEEFRESLIQFGYYNDFIIHQMFEYIKFRQKKMIDECLPVIKEEEKIKEEAIEDFEKELWRKDSVRGTQKGADRGSW